MSNVVDSESGPVLLARRLYEALAAGDALDVLGVADERLAAGAISFPFCPGLNLPGPARLSADTIMPDVSTSSTRTVRVSCMIF